MCVFSARLLRGAALIGRKSAPLLEEGCYDSVRDAVFRPKRLGGWLNDPLRSVPSEVGRIDSYRKFVLKKFVDPDKKLIRRIVARRRAEKLLSLDEETHRLGQEYLDMMFHASAVAPQPSEYLENKVNRILEARFNYNPASPSSKYLGKLEEQGERALLESSENAHGVDNALVEAADEPENVFERLSTCNKNTTLLNVWKEHMDFEKVIHNQCEIPNSFGYKEKEDEYRMLRKSAVVFDKSYTLIVKITGTSANYFLEQMLTFSVSKMAQLDVCYGSLLDSKGFIIDTCYVCKSRDEYILVTNGRTKKDIYDYLTSYAIHCKNYGLDIAIVPMTNFTSIGLYGPCSPNVLLDLHSRACNSENGTDASEDIRDVDKDVNCKVQLQSSADGEQLPAFMKCFPVKFSNRIDDTGNVSESIITCARISDTGEDGFEFIVPNTIVQRFSELLLSHKEVHPMGLKTYDIARLESGILRSDLDLTPECSPMQASLMWNVDIKKIRQKQLFGYKFIGHDLTGGVSKIRVGLICNEMVNKSSTILKSSNRMPIGFITSSAWSPALQMYIAHAYVNSEYAKHDTPVVLSIPKSPEDGVSKRVYEKYYRNHIFKKFAKATIVHLPFIIHNYPVPKDKKSYVGGRQVKFSPKKRPEPQTSELVPVTPPTEEKGKATRSRKQLWKDLIAKHRRASTGTLEMALTKWEKINKEVQSSKRTPEATFADSESLVPLWRINIIPTTPMDRRMVIKHYQDLHSEPVPSRHRRFRPPRKATE
ncbi:aminomethyltransferase, putative [Theileria equi strain WA]|uniref:Aminomethyltransferase, putative n=1 Tax=Theileria equi strain WA TaxID=1537102 RepID=L0AWT8_THEEQ|nr:aminomethyltransferase, putative [Theileria equi strain WA]AFZ80057.1 aminomethyltransferase, putative [Theileria equi strain WA]|eukprot:XP_004829723.1 aminomethyltransferase, putative [Theileria equi strain WA]